MTEPALELQAFVADGFLQLTLSGALVAGTTARLRTWMEAHVPWTAGRLVLDLAGLDDVDAVGLGALLAAPRRLGPGALVELTGAAPRVTLALRRAGLLALPRQQAARTAPTMAEVTTSTSSALLTNGGMA